MTILEVVLNSIKFSGPGYDEMSIGVYKECFHLLGRVFTIISDDSSLLSCFPHQLSIARVKYLFKSGDTKLAKNYRTISILPSFSEVLEKVAGSQLIYHLETNAL